MVELGEIAENNVFKKFIGPLSLDAIARLLETEDLEGFWNIVVPPPSQEPGSQEDEKIRRKISKIIEFLNQASSAKDKLVGKASLYISKLILGESPGENPDSESPDSESPNITHQEIARFILAIAQSIQEDALEGLQNITIHPLAQIAHHHQRLTNKKGRSTDAFNNVESTIVMYASYGDQLKKNKKS